MRFRPFYALLAYKYVHYTTQTYIAIQVFYYKYNVQRSKFVMFGENTSIELRPSFAM